MKGVAIRPTRKILFMLGGILVVVLGVSGLLAAKQYGQMAQVGKDIGGRQSELSKRQGLVRQLSKAMDDLAASREKVAHLEEGVTEKDYVPTLLGQIEAVGKECDLRVIGVEPQEKKPPVVSPPVPPEAQRGVKASAPKGGQKEQVDVAKPSTQAKPAEKEPYPSEQIQIVVTGTFWNVVDFLTRLTEFPKILAVSSMEVSQSKEGPEGISPTLSVTITFDAFVLDKKNDTQSVSAAPSGGAGKG
jgi:Tfp pilus assembly protein PilO